MTPDGSSNGPRLMVCDDAAAAAATAADVLSWAVHDACAARGRAVVALSGGQTPWAMLRAFSDAVIDPDVVTVLQVDERLAPEHDPARNLTHLVDALGPRLAPRIVPVPVDEVPLSGDTATKMEAIRCAEAYDEIVADALGDHGALDAVHLGLGADGHTASLLPGDPAAEVTDRFVTATRPYQGHRRVTLTRPTLDRAGVAVWFVLGPSKTPALRRLIDADPTIPAGRISSIHPRIIIDQAAADGLA